ncbi:hypothetical protein BDF21DRAFT_437777 [Thamnidium elegans]|nr:hypothetical protein BDF21DRAFT_437777 [Thamnidium elegans]
MVITRYSLRFVSTLYRNGQYRVPAGTVLPEGETDPQLERQIFIVEQSQLHTIYEKMLYLQVPLPKAGEVNTRVLDFVDQFASDFELIGTTAHDLRGFVEALDRASQRTFNSPLITRHLFSALVRLGEYEEAEQALHSYLYLVGLVSYGWKETRHDGQALATDKNGLNMPVPKPRPEIEDNESSDNAESYHQLTKEISGISDIKNSEKEHVSDTLHVLITAIKMYCNDLGRGVDAVEMAEIAKELYQKQPRRDRTSNLLEVGAFVYRATGIAYGSLGCQTFDPELRPTYHEKALSYLKRSLELDSNAWETYYQLALQQADMHDIGQAVQSITKAIQAQPSNVPSWHLLTLIISCPVHGDYRQALKTCEMGLQQAIDEGCPDIIEDSNGSGYDEAEQHMMFQMTRVLLLNALYGPEEALEFSKTLFGSFGKIAIPEASFSTSSLENLSYGGAHNGMVISGSLELASQMGSRSHDSVNVTTSKSTTIGRARSASNLAANPSPLGPGYNPATNAGLLAVPDTADAKPHHHHHLHGLHLFGSRSSSNRTKAIENNAVINGNTSIQSLNTPYDLKSLAGNSVASLQSISPSITSIQSILQPSVIPTKPSTRTVLRKQRSDRILSDLWLLTAQMFIKLGKLDEARKAVEEAENVDWISNPKVWCVLGQLLEAEGDFEQAQTAYNKSLVIDPNDVICRLWLAKSHIAQSNQEIAEGILEILTKSNGWDCAEAWFYLGEIYRQTDRLDRTKACLFYALELESTTPIQPFSVLPRYI